MAMETCSLLDDKKQASAQPDLTLSEIHKTRLIRTDLGPRTRTDPVQRWIQHYLRSLQYRKLSAQAESDIEARSSCGESRLWSHQNSILIASILSRITTALIICVFLIVPLIILSIDLPRSTELVIVVVWISGFSLSVGVMLKVSNSDVLAVSAAVLSVFVS